MRYADVIVAFEAGRLVERETHQELMKRGGHNHHLVSTQIEE